MLGVSKSYQDPKHPAVADFTLDIEEGEVVALLGPSGCGKTTLLRLIAGFEVPNEGQVYVSGREVVGPNVWVSPEHRKIGFVFQDYALFPHLTVLQNVAFGLSARQRDQRIRRAKEVLDLVGLTIFSRRYPHQLSGGQQQRVALARALAPEPDVILLDEPFSNLDAALRGSTREEVRRILKRTGTTTVLVTHDQEEAMTFADRLVVMRAGRLEQLGAPEEAYLRPRTAFVANFLGTTNLVRGEANGTFAHTILGALKLSEPAQGSVLLSVRPENLRFDAASGVPVRIVSRAFKGHDLTFVCESLSESVDSNIRLTVQTGPNCGLQVGADTYLQVRGCVVPLGGSDRV
ncbi:MAG: ABC transporter ATP-binding protein [Trueperaceae bacterium]|nr:MAG: ABC transporter ATP-binding protein [Trueperaceae bacterium]